MKWGFSTEMKRPEPVPSALHSFILAYHYSLSKFYIKTVNSTLNMCSTESDQPLLPVNRIHSSSMWNSVGLYPSFTYIVCTTLVIYVPTYFLSRL